MPLSQAPDSMRTETPLVRTSFCVSLHMAIGPYLALPFNKVVNVSRCLPEFCEPLSELTELKEVSVGTSSQSEAHITAWGLGLVSELGDGSVL